VEDDHVDRPGVEERQRLKLTGTNSSIGLIVLIPYAHSRRNPKDCRQMSDGWHNKDQRTAPTEPQALRLMLCCGQSLKSFSNNVRFADLVVMAERLHPIPFRTRP